MAGARGGRKSMAGVAGAAGALKRGSRAGGRNKSNTSAKNDKAEKRDKKPLTMVERKKLEVKENLERLEKECKDKSARIDALLIELDQVKVEKEEALTAKAAAEAKTESVKKELEAMEESKWSIDSQRIEAESTILRMKTVIQKAEDYATSEREKAAKASNDRERMCLERNNANEARERAEMQYADLQGKFYMTAKANTEAQEMMRDVTIRDKARAREMHKMRKAHAIAISDNALECAETVSAVSAMEAKLAAERKSFVERQKRYREEIARIESERVVDRHCIAELKERLAKPPPSMEQIRDVISKAINSMTQSITERISETDAFRGGETLRWKMIRTNMETISVQVSRIFDVLTPEIYRRDAALREKETIIEEQKDAHEVTKEQVRYVAHERDMLHKLFHPEPNLDLKDAKLAKYCDNNGQDKDATKHLAGRVVQKPVPMRARLLLSEIKTDKVAQIIEKNRTWNDSCSTLLLSCCAACGAFFLDSDMAWPCECASTNGYSTEHQEYTLFHDNEALQEQVRDNLLSGQVNQSNDHTLFPSRTSRKNGVKKVRSTICILPAPR